MRRFLIILSIFWLMTNIVSAQDVISSPYEIALERIAEAEANSAYELDLSYLDLTSLPPEIGNLFNLQILYL